MTPLMRAAAGGHTATVAALLRLRADVHASDNSGMVVMGTPRRAPLSSALPEACLASAQLTRGCSADRAPARSCLREQERQ